MLSDTGNTYFFHGIPERVCLVREGGQGEIDPSEMALQRPGSFGELFSMSFDFVNEIVSSFLQAFCILK